MAEERTNIPRPCPKDCQKCSMAQQLYCSTNLAFMSYEMVSKVLERLEGIENNIRVMQGVETEMINPIAEAPKSTNHKRQAVEIIGSQE